MRRNKSVILLLLLILSAGRVGAQAIWQHVDGLPCEETSGVAQDARGYIWIGTRLGLLRYDGYNIVTYRNDLERPYAFSSCNIQCLTADSADCVWAGSFFGLNRFSAASGQATPIHFGGSDLVKAVCVDSRKRRWAGTDTGLYQVVGGTEPVHYDAVPRDMILQIRELAEGQIVVLTRQHGLYLIGASGHCTPLAGTDALEASAVCAGDSGTLWIGTRRGEIFRWRDSWAKPVHRFEGVTVNDLMPYPNGQDVLLATNRGVCCLSDRVSAASLPGMAVNSLFADKDGNVWAATASQGVFFLQNQSTVFSVRQPSFVKQTVPIVSQFSVNHLADTALWAGIRNVNAVCETAGGLTYVGTGGSGLYIIENGAVKHHLTKDNTPWLGTNSIHCFAALDRETMLIGTWYGLYAMNADGSDGRPIGHIGGSDISTMHTLTAAVTGSNDVWLGLVGGIAHIEGALTGNSQPAVTLYTHVGNKGRKNVENIGRLTDFHDETGDYQLGGIYRIVKDPKGRIWACTSEPGLLLYDAEHDMFRSVSGQLGIPGDNVHSLDIDSHGAFWMTTNYGILQMKIDDDGQPEAFQLYTRHDGLPSNYYGSTISCVLSDRTLCFLNQQNLVTITPGPLTRAKRRKTFISEMYVNSAPLAGVGPETTRITLSHLQNNLALRFTTLSLGREASVRYAYRLEGFDREYRQTDMGANGISYHQLPPGTYTLHYCSQNNESASDNAEETLTIEILQPWWWRWWAIACYALIIFAVAAFILHTVSDRRKKQRQLEALESEKQQQEQLYRKKVQFYVRVLHNFLTPLTLVSDLAHGLRSRVRPSLQASMFMLSNQTDQLLEAMNNIVDVKDDTSASEALQKAQEITRVDRDFLHRCTESVNSHIADSDYSHKVMMKEVGASHATLYRKLKALTGMDATSFIRSIRMRAAYQILSANPGIRIGELAERVGYSNPRYFSACFKNEYGMTPRECIAKWSE